MSTTKIYTLSLHDALPIFVKAHRYRAGHDFLGLGEERIECFSEGSKPVALIDHLRIANAQDVFVVAGLPIQHQRFQLAVRRGDKRSARSFINTARLHSNDAVLNAICTAYAVRAGDFV